MPTIGPNTFCTIPALSAWRVGPEAAAMMARQIGRNGPSAAPITTRVASRLSKLQARPDSTEQAENSSSAPIRNGLRRPIRSDQRPIRNAPRAQVSDSPELAQPISSFVSDRSSCTNGARKVSAMRSK